MLVGHIDESVRWLDTGREYLIAAVITDDQCRASHQTALRALLLPGQQKLHWRDESERRRLEIVSVVGSLGVIGLVVVRSCGHERRTERARRLCLAEAYRQLSDLDVFDAVLESRGAADDRLDRDHLNRIRQSHLIPGSFRIEHAPGPTDPLLWLPDILCLTVNAARAGDRRFLNAYTVEVEITEVTP